MANAAQKNPITTTVQTSASSIGLVKLNDPIVKNGLKKNVGPGYPGPWKPQCEDEKTWLLSTVHLLAARISVSPRKTVSSCFVLAHIARRRGAHPGRPGPGGTSWHAGAGLASTLCMQITYWCLPYFQTTPPMANTSPRSAPNGSSTGMCVSHATSQPTRP